MSNIVYLMRGFVSARTIHQDRRYRRWKTARDRSTSWHATLRVGRVQIGYHVHRHAGHLPDRWVFQPWLTYDRGGRG